MKKNPDKTASPESFALSRRELARHLRTARLRHEETPEAVETRLADLIETAVRNLIPLSETFRELASRGAVRRLESDRGGTTNLAAAELEILAAAYRVSRLLLQSLQAEPDTDNRLVLSFNQFNDLTPFGVDAEYSVAPSKLLHADDVDIVHLRLGPGGRSDTHAHAGDELLFVVQGEIDVWIESSGLTAQLKKGDYLHFYSEQTHTAINRSDSRPAVALIIRFYQFESSSVRSQALRDLRKKNPPKNAMRRIEAEMSAALRFRMAPDDGLADEVIDRLGLGRLLELLCSTEFRQSGPVLTMNELARRGAEYGLTRAKIGRIHQGLAPVPRGLLSGLAAMYEVEPLILFEYLFPALRSAVAVHCDHDLREIPSQYVNAPGVRYFVPCRRLAESDVAVAVLDIAPDSSGTVNFHPGRELLFPISGNAILNLQGEGIRLSIRDRTIAHFQSHVPHFVSNPFRKSARVLVIRFYE